MSPYSDGFLTTGVSSTLRPFKEIILHSFVNKMSLYSLGENETRPLLDSLQYSAVFHLYLYHKERNKCSEVPYTQAFMGLCKRPHLSPGSLHLLGADVVGLPLSAPLFHRIPPQQPAQLWLSEDKGHLPHNACGLFTTVLQIWGTCLSPSLLYFFEE